MKPSLRKLITIVSFFAILSIFIISALIEYERAVSEEKKDLLENLQILSASVNQRVTQSIENGNGLVAYIKTFPNLSQDEFSDYAKRIFDPNQTVVRHYTVLKDTTITYVYPYEDNKGAIGVDLVKIDAQREDTLRIKNDRISMFVGPVNLVQGGRALINRMPVVIDGEYWGQLSLVINYDKLLDSSGIADFSMSHYIAIEQKQGEYIEDKVFYTNTDTFSEDAIIDQFNVPNGEWILTVEPKDGYNGLTSIFYLLIVLGLIFSTLVSVFTYIILLNNEKLNRTVEERTLEIRATNLELKNSIHHLEATKEQLVLREKHAALGELVAGVAHEINTPLGVCITVNSYMQTTNEAAKESLAMNALKKSDLISTFDKIQESTEILGNNLDRVSQLILSFKKLATDQHLDEYKKIDFKEYLDYIIKSISPTFKGTKHTIKHTAVQVEIKTYPSAIFQVITNLIMNSYIHGFVHVEEGKIIINAQIENDNLVIDYYDNGKGIPIENAEKIYDPFFTTNREQGSTGLGMNIVYNNVFQKLMGTIELLDKEDEGVHFKIILPLNDQ